MIQNAVFRRKVIYLGLIALLLIPLYVVGHPAVGDPTDPNSSPGGRLAQLRAQHDLSPAELGEVDPTSESMKLATLGMRGVAASILWSKAQEFKKKENWEGLAAVINQIVKLQPHFISVWEFQSHELSYNVSVEQDDYRFRYLWVKKGIEFLIQGTHYNRLEPKMFKTVGWYTGQKFNRADESKQFRRLFKADHDFHDLQSHYVDVDGQARGADGRPDSWLVSRLWYNRAYDIVDTQSRPIRGDAPHLFYSYAPKALMNYAGAIEEDGYLDERAQYSWKRASDDWDRLGERQVPTSNGLLIRLNDEEAQLAATTKLAKDLDELVPGLRQTIEQEKRAKLTPQEIEALEKPNDQIADVAMYMLKSEATNKIAVTNMEVAERAPANVRARAMRLAQEAANAALHAEWIDKYRSNINFEYWRTRCRIEQLPDAVAARRHIYTANQLKEKVELDAARREYEKAWDLWAKVIEQYPALVDELTADDLIDYVTGYLKLLDQMDLKVPADFKLRGLMEKHGKLPVARVEDSATESAEPATPAPAKPETSPEAKKSDAQPTAKPEEKVSAKPVEKPADKAEDNKAEDKVENKASENAPNTAAEPSPDKPADKPAEKTVEPPATEKPATEKPETGKAETEKPAADHASVEQPAAKSAAK